MTRPAQRRYPWAPIGQRLDELARRHRLHNVANDTVHPTTITELAAAIGMNRRNLQRYVAEGVPASRTDEIAIAVGLLEEEAWPEIHEHAVADEDAQRRARAAARKRKQYRRRKHEILARNRRYREEASTAISKQRRRRYEARRDEERAASKAYYEANREAILERARLRRQERAA